MTYTRTFVSNFADTDVRFMEQNVRITVLETEVVDWSDNITALEEGVSEVQERVDLTYWKKL